MNQSFSVRPVDRRALRHDKPIIVLHWLTFALVGILWTIGQTVDFAPSGAARVDYRSVHITLGIVLAGVLLLRIGWRAIRGGMLPPLNSGLLLAASRMVHGLLYVLLVATVLLGLTNVWVRGDSVFTLFAIPSFAPGDRPLRQAIEGYHALAANALVILALLHAAVALFHHYVLRDSTLSRMWPWRMP
jgi:cytochrome b561